jgi:hypothetical protein
MTCSEFLALLDDVLADKLPKDVREDLERHLYRCGNCEVILNTTRKTIEVYRCNELYEMPEELRTRLHESIMKKCKDSGGCGCGETPTE